MTGPGATPASYFPDADVTVVVDAHQYLLVALLPRRPRRGGLPPVRQIADAARPGALSLLTEFARIPQAVHVVVARDAEEVAALSAAWELGEAEASAAVQRGRYDHPGGRAAVEPLLTAAHSEGRYVSPEAAVRQADRELLTPRAARPKPAGPKKRRTR